MQYETDTDLIAYIRGWVGAKGMNAVPGVPLSRFSISGAAMSDVRRLIADGALELVDVTKPSATNPTRTVTYSYVRVAKEA